MSAKRLPAEFPQDPVVPVRVRTRAERIEQFDRRLDAEDGQEETTESEAAAGPTVLARLEDLAHNPGNPRLELTLLQETADTLRENGQLVALTVVTREAFLAAHPQHTETIGTRRWVVLDGNRRLAAAPLAGLTELRIDVNDALVGSATEMLENALVANLHRESVPALDEARAIRGLMEIHGSQGKVSRRLGKSEVWVSQRLALLELPEDLQEKVTDGELKIKEARRIGRLPKEQQRDAAAATLNRVKAPRAAKGGTESSPAPEGGSSAPSEDPAAEPTLNPVKGDAALPEQSRAEANPLEAAVDEVVRLAADPEVLAEVLARRLSSEVLESLTHRLLAHL